MGGDLGATLRARGMRLTPQRELILNAVARLEHGTPDEILAEVRRSAGSVNASTIYRGLELLERLGLITHSHLGHATASYHLAEQAGHLHLVCRDCGEVIDTDPSCADDLVRQVSERYGFEPDMRHFAIYGRCRACRGAES